jgi:hypothetical protein
MSPLPGQPRKRIVVAKMIKKNFTLKGKKIRHEYSEERQAEQQRYLREARELQERRTHRDEWLARFEQAFSNDFSEKGHGSGLLRVSKKNKKKNNFKKNN